MNLLNKFFASVKGTLVDERKQAKDAFFIELTLDCEKLLKRTLTASELCVIYDLTDHQTEVLHKMISEANKG